MDWAVRLTDLVRDRGVLTGRDFSHTKDDLVQTIDLRPGSVEGPVKQVPVNDFRAGRRGETSTVTPNTVARGGQVFVNVRHHVGVFRPGQDGEIGRIIPYNFIGVNARTRGRTLDTKLTRFKDRVGTPGSVSLGVDGTGFFGATGCRVK